MGRQSKAKSLVTRIVDLNEQIDAEAADPPLKPHVLGNPLAAKTIDSSEKKLHVIFPPSYRDFLSVCNGFKGITGLWDMLSVEEMASGPYFDEIQAWKASPLGSETMSASKIFVVGWVLGKDLLDVDLAALDLGTRDDKGECPILVIRFSRGQKEVEEFPNFYSHLGHIVETLEFILEDLQEP